MLILRTPPPESRKRLTVRGKFATINKGFRGSYGRGRSSGWPRKVRAPQGTVVGNSHRVKARESATENRPPAVRRVRVKRWGSASELNVRAHRPGGDVGGRVNPTGSKAK